MLAAASRTPWCLAMVPGHGWYGQNEVFRAGSAGGEAFSEEQVRANSRPISHPTPLTPISAGLQNPR